MDGLWMIYGWLMDDLRGILPGFRADTFSEGVSPKSFLDSRKKCGESPNFWSKLGLQFDVPSKRIMAIMG